MPVKQKDSLAHSVVTLLLAGLPLIFSAVLGQYILRAAETLGRELVAVLIPVLLLGLVVGWILSRLNFLWFVGAQAVSAVLLTALSVIDARLQGAPAVMVWSIMVGTSLHDLYEARIERQAEDD